MIETRGRCNDLLVVLRHREIDHLCTDRVVNDPGQNVGAQADEVDSASDGERDLLAIIWKTDDTLDILFGENDLWVRHGQGP